ncbi:MAG: DNA polymerase III subunit delta [Woeseiaceae bacterium]|nr:DNA polymerase III subunit delta [Woeseiaceae bacterium]
MKVNANQLSSHLQNKLAPCYLITGDEHLLVNEALDAVRAAARTHGFASRDLHVATTGFDWAQLYESSANLSLFAERRIVEVRLPTGKPGRAGSQAIVELAEQTGDDLMLVVSGPKLDRGAQSAKWVKALDAKGVSVPVWPIGLRELPGWIAARMRNAGLQPDRGAVAMIADRVEGNLLAAGQEIEKLRLLLGEGKVTAEDVSNAVANSSRFDVFKLADAALAGDTRRALRILSGLRSEGVEPVIVVWSLTRDLRTLASLTDLIAQGTDLASGMQKAGVWRNRQAIVRNCIGRHKHGDFHRLLKLANLADQAAKGQTRADPWQLATDLILGMTLSGRQAA